MATAAVQFTIHQSHHCLLQNVDSNKVTSYFYYRRATDNSSEHNIQAVKKGQLLLNGNRVEACSVAVHKSDIYVTGMVRAAMKKKVWDTNALDLHGRQDDMIPRNI